MRRRNRNGLTLVESLVAATVAAIGVTALVFPLTASVLVDRQEKVLDEARNLARIEVENMRNFWATSTNYGAANAPVTLQIDPLTWRFNSTASQPVTVQMATRGDTLRDLTAAQIDSLLPTAVSATYPANTTPTAVATGVLAINVPLPRANNPAQRADYIGQVLIGRTPGVANDKARRLVVRIYAATNNSGTLAFASGAGAVRSEGVITGDGAVSRTSLGQGPLAVLVEDIAGPL